MPLPMLYARGLATPHRLKISSHQSSPLMPSYPSSFPSNLRVSLVTPYVVSPMTRVCSVPYLALRQEIRRTLRAQPNRARRTPDPDPSR